MIADCGFAERLVVFWSNHFCISANKGGLARMWAGSFEREAIRPHVLGRFGDMLKAVEQHPAMLFFLDNQHSLGPESRAGQNRKRGLNENLAREIMELHTLGVGGGYSQDDVTSLARIITGWTYAGRQGQLGAPGTFVFNANAHQPGAQRLLGKNYENTGVAQGEAALADLARHPSTAKFIATKFARHFVADDPPPALVARLRDVFGKSDGDLKALAIALLDSDEAWQTPMTKMRSPYEFLVATGRLLGRDPGRSGRYLGGLNVLGQPLWSPAGPNGFPDSNAAWAAPEGMKLRLDISAQLARGSAKHRSPRPAGLVAADAASTGDPADHRARGIAAAGAGAAVDVAGIPEEMTMDCCESRTSFATIAAGAAARRRVLRRLGLSAEIRARRRRPRSAPDRRDPARRARWPRHRGADRRSRLRRPAWLDRACLRTVRIRRVMLDSFFALHPSMPEFARMYRDKQAAVVHAVATPYRDRSHFDGQDVLESGFAGPGRVQSGWLNRALEALPRGERVMSGLVIGPTTPLVLRGAAPTVGWAPAALPQAADDTAARLIDSTASRSRAGRGTVAGPAARQGGAGRRMKPKPGTNGAGAMRLVARGVAKLMSADDGPRIAALAFDGWDTHANEGGPVGRLAQLTVRPRRRAGGIRNRPRRALARHGDRGRHRVRPHRADQRHRWHRSRHRHRRAVGRRRGEGRPRHRRLAGPEAGEPLRGPRSRADHRLRAVIKGVLHDHLGLSERVLAETVFPDSAGVKPMKGLVGRRLNSMTSA